MKSSSRFLRIILYLFIVNTFHQTSARLWARTNNFRELEIERTSSDALETCEDLTGASLCTEKKHGCTVLVDSIQEFLTCENYCHMHYRKCFGAWDEDRNTCKPKETYGCNFEFRNTSDALCKCSKSRIFFSNSDTNRSVNSEKTTDGDESKCPSIESDFKEYAQIHPEGKNYNEISMIAVSKQKWRGNNVIWFANDKDETYVHASSLESGEHICSVKLQNEKDGDIESMSIGPCNTDLTTSCLYVANIGNNPAQSCEGGRCNEGREFGSIFKFKEPNIRKCYRSGEVEVSIAVLPVNYMDIASPSERSDAESFFVDPVGDQNNGKPGDLYVITKWNDRSKEILTRLFKYPVENHQNAIYGETWEVYSMQPTESSKLKDETWTDADINSDGSLIATRTVRRVYFYTRNRFESVAEALKKDPCFTYETPKFQDFEQFEAVGFIPNEKAFIEMSECKQENYGNCNPHAYVISYE